MTDPSLPRLVITVDVEAQPERAECDPVERLIWGRYPDGPQGGIDALMSIADRHRAKLVMFFDFAEAGFYGDTVLDAAREIDRRGHDLELHAHARFLPKEYWHERGVRPVRGTDVVDADQARTLLDFLCETHSAVTGRSPVAFRGGGYRYNANLLRAMAEHGVIVDSSYNAGRPNQLLARGPVPQFRWDAGCVELPISCVPGFVPTRLLEFNFNAAAFSKTASPEAMLRYLDSFYGHFGRGAVAVLVLHSWSLSRRGEDGMYSPPLSDYIERFDAFLAAIADRVQCVTALDVPGLVAQGELGLGEAVPVDEVDHTLVTPRPRSVAEEH